MRRVLPLALLAAACAAEPSDLDQVPNAAAVASPGIVVPAGYTLVWQDEFNADGRPDPASWAYETGLVRNKELQWYQPDNARVQGGRLIIEARRERKNEASYTSSSLLSRGKREFQYGIFEMRAKIPVARGTWPAFWTLGVRGEWPSNGEIDIMEFYQGKILANVACGTNTRWQAKWDSSTRPVSSFPAGWADAFHVWRMVWTADTIDLYVDNERLNTTALRDMKNPDGKSPFQQPHYLLVNLAIGGNNGGDPSGTAFPVRYEVDYIRVFQRAAK
jgi:beta-glucanase (GH16 family)